MRSRVAAVCLFAGLLSSNAMAQSVVGYWYGQGYQPLLHDTSQFIAHYREDGAFDIHFRVYKNCVLTFDQWEMGTWTMLNEHTIRIVTRFVGLKAAGPYVDDYDTEELTAQRYRYMWIGKKIEYSASRVDAQFTFPDCEIIS